MKKILGILGVTLIIAVSFFNMSSVVDANQNVDLASIIQNASADSENYWGYDSKEETFYLYSNSEQYQGKLCAVSGTEHTVTCNGDGDVDCEEVYEIIDKEYYNCIPW